MALELLSFWVRWRHWKLTSALPFFGQLNLTSCYSLDSEKWMHFKIDKSICANVKWSFLIEFSVMHFISVIVILPLQCVCALEFPNDNKNQWNDFDALLCVMKLSHRSKQSTEDLIDACYSTTFMHHNINSSSISELLSLCTLCSVQCAMCALTSKQLIFYSLRWHSHY